MNVDAMTNILSKIIRNNWPPDRSFSSRRIFPVASSQHNLFRIHLANRAYIWIKLQRLRVGRRQKERKDQMLPGRGGGLSRFSCFYSRRSPTHPRIRKFSRRKRIKPTRLSATKCFRAFVERRARDRKLLEGEKEHGELARKAACKRTTAMRGTVFRRVSTED